MTEQPTLLGFVSEALKGGGVRFALVGASALAVHGADLVLLKLYAGGSQDRWDIEQLLARPDRDAVVSEVENRLSRLPARSRRTWEEWRR